MTAYDVIVLGTGGVGSAVLRELASRKVRVLGLDRFPAGHDRGSSHGQTRIIRQAYFEHPDYVPLLQRAYALWEQVQQAWGQQLFFPVGLLEIGPPHGVVVPGVLEAAGRYGLAVERLTADQAARQFPGLQVPAGCEAVFERQAGYLLVEDCVVAQIELARRAGAEFLWDQEVVGWRAGPGHVEVRTASQTYRAERLVITAGAWSAGLLADLGIPLRVVRKHLHWYAADHPDYQQRNGCPTFFYELPEGYFYGFPALDAGGVKVAEHTGGELVANPLSVDRQPDPLDRTRVESFLQACLPGVTRHPLRHAVCMYTLSPDEHFVVDRHPDHSGVVFAAGLSGHGFKFAPVLAEALADLALEGTTRLPIGFLGCCRWRS